MRSLGGYKVGRERIVMNLFIIIHDLNNFPNWVFVTKLMYGGACTSTDPMSRDLSFGGQFGGARRGEIFCMED